MCTFTPAWSGFSVVAVTAMPAHACTAARRIVTGTPDPLRCSARLVGRVDSAAFPWESHKPKQRPANGLQFTQYTAHWSSPHGKMNISIVRVSMHATIPWYQTITSSSLFSIPLPKQLKHECSPLPSHIAHTLHVCICTGASSGMGQYLMMRSPVDGRRHTQRGRQRRRRGAWAHWTSTVTLNGATPRQCAPRTFANVTCDLPFGLADPAGRLPLVLREEKERWQASNRSRGGCGPVNRQWDSLPSPPPHPLPRPSCATMLLCMHAGRQAAQQHTR